jgi:hypothetical protein
VYRVTERRTVPIRLLEVFMPAADRAHLRQYNLHHFSYLIIERNPLDTTFSTPVTYSRPPILTLPVTQIDPSLLSILLSEKIFGLGDTEE